MGELVRGHVVAIELWTPEGERRLEQVMSALQPKRDELVSAIEVVAGNVREIAAADDRAQRGPARRGRRSRR